MLCVLVGEEGSVKKKAYVYGLEKSAQWRRRHMCTVWGRGLSEEEEGICVLLGEEGSVKKKAYVYCVGKRAQ